MTQDQDSPRQDDTRTMTASRQMLPTGTVLAGRYRILEVLGSGGMGVVYRAHDATLDTEVALKTLSEHVSGDDQALERFRGEIRLARKVSHPNVVRIHDIGTDGDIVFMSMDLVRGRTLVEHLSHGPMAPAKAVSIAMQIADALAEAHRHGIVHRDLKPSNILVDDSGNAWLSDFGVARAIDQQGPTRAGQTVGTLAYMAPEQIRGEEVDGRCDLYALALVLWEMLTGHVPLKGETGEETIARRLNPAPPGRLPEDSRVPRALRRIVVRCLAPAPDDRPADAVRLRQALAQGKARLGWRRVIRRAGWATVIVAIAGLGTWFFAGLVSSPAGSGASPPAVAVMPVVNATGNPEFDWIRNSMAESTAIRLAENRNLNLIDPARVRSTLSDLRLDAAVLDNDKLGQVADLMGADRIVHGTLVGSADELRLQIRVIDSGGGVRTAFQLDAASNRLLAATDRIAERITQALDVAPTSSGRQELPVPMSDDPRALMAFDSGIEASALGNHQRAIEHLDAAVAQDPEFGMAWARLADARAEAGLFDEALAAAERAAELLDGQGGRAEARAKARQAALAGQTERAIEGFEALVERYPNDTDAKLALAELLADAGGLERALQLAREVTENEPGHPRAWFLLGKFAVMSGDVRRAAEDYFIKALVIQNRLGNSEGRAEVLNGLGIVHERLGDLDAAIGYYSEAAALREQAGDRRGHAASLSNLARLNMIGGDYEAARESLHRALSIREQIGDLSGMAQTYNEFGVLEEEVGNYGDARIHYRDALRIHDQLGNLHAINELRTSLAFIHLMLGEYDTAEAFATRTLGQQAEAGDTHGQMSTLQILGELEIARGDWTDAQAHLLRALGLAREIGNPFGEATVHGSIGLLAGMQGRVNAALAAYDEALALLEPLDDRRGLAEYHLRAAETLESIELLEASRQHWNTAREFFGVQANLSQRARLTRIEGILAAAAGDSGAAAIFDEALQLAHVSGAEPVALRIRASRLRRLGGGRAELEQLFDDANRLGHRTLQLQASILLAGKQLEMGIEDGVLKTLDRALRPPLALESWVGNWRLHQLRERIRPTDSVPPTSRRLLAELAAELPSDMKPAFRQLHGL